MKNLIEKQEKEEENIEIPANLLKKGDRVFHPKFGIGNIDNVVPSGKTFLYIVEFNRYGKKSLDSDYSQLKKF